MIVPPTLQSYSPATRRLPTAPYQVSTLPSRQVVWRHADFEIIALFDKLQLAEITEAWARLAAHPSVDPQTYLSRLRCDEEAVAPACLVARDGDSVRAILVGMLLDKRLVFRASYLPVCSIRARVWAVADQGLLGSTEPAVVFALIGAIVELLKTGVADLVHFACVDAQSMLRKALTDIPPAWLRGRLEILEDRWTLSLGARFDDFLTSRSQKTRARIRRHERRLLATHPSVRVLMVGHNKIETTLAHVMPDLMAVLRSTYQFRLKLTPLCRPSAIAELELLDSLRRLVLVVVYIGERPAAFSYAHVYKGTAALGTPGYDPEFAEFYVGEHALVTLIRVLIARGDTATLDYGLGYAQYKEAFGSSFVRQGHLRLFAPSLRGLTLNSIRTGTFLATRSLNTLARGLHIEAGLKRLLRGRRGSGSTKRSPNERSR